MTARPSSSAGKPRASKLQVTNVPAGLPRIKRTGAGPVAGPASSPPPAPPVPVPPAPPSGTLAARRSSAQPITANTSPAISAAWSPDTDSVWALRRPAVQQHCFYAAVWPRRSITPANGRIASTPRRQTHSGNATPAGFEPFRALRRQPWHDADLHRLSRRSGRFGLRPSFRREPSSRR